MSSTYAKPQLQFTKTALSAPFFGSVVPNKKGNNPPAVVPHVMAVESVAPEGAIPAAGLRAGSYRVVFEINSGIGPCLGDVYLQVDRAALTGNFVGTYADRTSGPYFLDYEGYEMIDRVELQVDSVTKFRVTGEEMLDRINNHMSDSERQILAAGSLGMKSIAERRRACRTAQTMHVKLLLPFDSNNFLPVVAAGKRLRVIIYFRTLQDVLHSAASITGNNAALGANTCNLVCEVHHFPESVLNSLVSQANSVGSEGHVYNFTDREFHQREAVTISTSASAATSTTIPALQLRSLVSCAYAVGVKLRYQSDLSSQLTLFRDYSLPFRTLGLIDGASSNIIKLENQQRHGIATVVDSRATQDIARILPKTSPGSIYILPLVQKQLIDPAVDGDLFAGGRELAKYNNLRLVATIPSMIGAGSDAKIYTGDYSEYLEQVAGVVTDGSSNTALYLDVYAYTYNKFVLRNGSFEVMYNRF
jgi:hypothetical protein